MERKDGTRVGFLLGYQLHPVLNKVLARLSSEEFEFALEKANEADELGWDKGQFERAVNRMFIDKPKPKHWKEITELLSCANSAL